VIIRRLLRKTHGLSLVETLLAALIGTLLVGGIIYLMTQSGTFFRRMRTRQQVQLESRGCMDRIDQLFRNARARSLVISTPPGTPIVPNSRVDFVLQRPLASGATAYAIYLEGNTVYGEEFSPTADRAPQPLATRVTGLMFTGDSRDPGFVGISLRIDAPWDANTSDPSRMSTLIVPNHIVHLVESP
jgi:hypothetical protein